MSKFRDETIHLENLRVDCIIGVRPHERETPQPLFITLSFPWDFGPAHETEALETTVNYSAVAQETTRFVQAGEFQLLETLARSLAQHLGQQFGLTELSLKVTKPQAIPASDGPAVSLTWYATEEGK